MGILDALKRALVGGDSGDPTLLDHLADQKPIESAVTVANPKRDLAPPDYDEKRREAIERAKARGLERPLATETRAPRITEASHVLEHINARTEEAKRERGPLRLATRSAKR